MAPPSPLPVSVSKASETATRPIPIHWRRPSSNPKKRSASTARKTRPPASTAWPIEIGARESAATCSARGSDLDPDFACPTVLPCVREALLDDADEHYPLRVGQRIELTLRHQHHLHVRLSGVGVGLALQQLRQRTGSERRRLQRVAQRPEPGVERGEASLQVLHSADEDPPLLWTPVGRAKLVAKGPHLGGQEGHLLQRLVVQVEAKAGEPALAGLDERALSWRRFARAASGVRASDRSSRPPDRGTRPRGPVHRVRRGRPGRRTDAASAGPPHRRAGAPRPRPPRVRPGSPPPRPASAATGSCGPPGRRTRGARAGA